MDEAAVWRRLFECPPLWFDSGHKTARAFTTKSCLRGLLSTGRTARRGLPKHESSSTKKTDHSVTSRPFDPNWTTDTQELATYLDDLCNRLAAHGRKGRARRQDAQPKFDASVRAIVLDLYRAHLSDPDLEVGIATGTGPLQKLGKSRYGASFVSARTFTDAMHALEGHGLIYKSRGHRHDTQGNRGRVARYKCTPALIGAMRKLGVSGVDLCKRKTTDGIRLKDEKKRLIEYGDTAFSNRARDRLSVINGELESHWADLALSDEQLASELRNVRGTRDDEAAQTFDFSARTVYRVFNNNDWGQGGRFYGAWWISCPSRLRPYILIDGKRTVEVDFSGLHAAMLYAQEGIAVPDDPYERCLAKRGDRAERALVKQTFNALLNADGVDRIKEIDGYSPDTTGRQWHDFKWFIVNSFPEFAQYFGSGVGLRLQRKDSDLAETVMLRFAAMGFGCLPVHDSFIVHHGLQDELGNIMRTAFEAEFGVAGNVGVDKGIGEVVVGNASPIEPDLDQLLCPTGYEARLVAFWTNKDRRSQ